MLLIFDGVITPASLFVNTNKHLHISMQNRLFLHLQHYLLRAHLFHLRGSHPRLYLRRTPIVAFQQPSWGIVVELYPYAIALRVLAA